MNVIPGSFPLLTILVVLPLVVSLVLLAVPQLRPVARPIALSTSLVELMGFVLVAATFDYAQAADFQWAETYEWIPLFGTSWALGVTGLSLVMLLLATALVPLVLLAEWNRDGAAEGGRYAALILCLEFFIVVIFAARDLFIFYLAFEAMLVPLYLLIGQFGRTAERGAAALKFVIYSLVGGLIMLVGVIWIPVTQGWAPDSFLWEAIAARGIDAGSSTATMLMFVSFFIAFAIKAPMVPVHTWLADTAEAARPGTSTLLVGVLDKIGTYGMIMVCLRLFPQQARIAAPVIVVLAIVSILYGAVAALGSRDLLRLISFTSVSHFGFMVMAIFIGSTYALTGAMVYMVAHGVTIAGLFLLAGALVHRGGTSEIAAYGGLQRVTPVLAGTFLVTGLASVALPGLSGFVPEYMILLGTYDVSPWAAAIAVISVIIAALYMLLPYQRIFTGPPEKAQQLSDLTGLEKLVVTPLVIAMVVLGVWAAPLIDTVSPLAETSPVTPISAMEGSAQ